MAQHSKLLQEMYKQARKVMNHAYAPYSNYHVGAAIITDQDDRIFTSCNVENVSYGLSLCAERNTVTKMISEVMKPTIKHLLIVVSGSTFAASCGACRQVIAEFSTPQTRIHLAQPSNTSEDGFETRTYSIDDFLPFNFSQDDLFSDTGQAQAK